MKYKLILITIAILLFAGFLSGCAGAAPACAGAMPGTTLGHAHQNADCACSLQDRGSDSETNQPEIRTPRSRSLTRNTPPAWHEPAGTHPGQTTVGAGQRCLLSRSPYPPELAATVLRI